MKHPKPKQAKSVQIQIGQSPKLHNVLKKTSQNNFLLTNAKQIEDQDPLLQDKKVIKMRNVIDDGKRYKTVLSDYDNQYMEQLDQWQEKVHAQKKSFGFEHDNKKETKKQPQFEFAEEDGPSINCEVINQILKEKKDMKSDKQEDEEVLIKFQTMRNSNNMYKTLDQVRIEMNKKILNSLLLDKVTKKINQQQANTRSHRDEDTDTLFKEEARQLKLKTLNNFKGLTEYFKNPAQFIDYEEVLTKVKHYSNKLPQSISSMNEPGSLSGTSSIRSLMETYQQFQQTSKEHKQLLFTLRIENNAFASEITRIEEEIINLKRKFYQREEKVRSGQAATQDGDLPSPLKRQSKNTIMEVLNKLRYQREQEESMYQLQITQIKSQINQNNEKQQLIQKELDEIHSKKRRCKMMLKDLYLKVLYHAEHQMVNDGLVACVKGMKRINAPPKAELFPKFLDGQSVAYIYKMADIEQQIEDLRSLITKHPIQIQHHSEIQLGQMMGTYQSVSEIKEQVKNIFKKNKLMVKKPVFVQGIDPLNPGKYSHIIKWENQEIETKPTQDTETTFKASRLIVDANMLGNKEINQKLLYLQQEAETLQKQELVRIEKVYANKKGDLKEVKRVMYALFGQNKGDVYFNEFAGEELQQVKDKEKVEERSTLPLIPAVMKQKLVETESKLNRESETDFRWDFIDRSKRRMI